MSSKHYEILIFRYGLLLSGPQTFCWLIDTIEVVLNHIELFHSESNGVWYDFSESEIKTANLPLLIACEELNRIRMALHHQRNSLLTFSGNGKVGKLFQELLLPDLESVCILSGSILLLDDGSVHCLADLIGCLLLIVFSKFEYFIWRDHFILLRFEENLLCSCENWILGGF